MITLTRKTEYALIALTHLAHEAKSSEPGCCSAREIASRYGVPLALLMNVLKQLAQGGLAKSSRGPQGGYSLAKSADDISLVDVMSTIEGPIHLVNCAGLLNEKENCEQGKNHDKVKNCDIMSSCPVGPYIRKVDARLMEFLQNVKLSDLLDDHRHTIQMQKKNESSTQELDTQGNTYAKAMGE
jgi:Rrf2 family protein